MNCYTHHLSDDTYCIFLLHGVIKSNGYAVRNYTRKHLPLDDFRMFLDEITDAGTCISMDEIVAAHQGKFSLPKKAFALTFDDGFRNNYTNIAPELNQRGLPATFYLATQFVSSQMRSWTDEIEAAIETWNVVAPSGRQDLMNWIRAKIKSSSQDPYLMADQWVAEFGGAGPFDDELDAKMTWADVRDLASNPLFTIGGHSCTHRSLGMIPYDEMRREIWLSLNLLRKCVSVDHYSYPEGQERDYSFHVIDELKKLGIKCAPTAMEGVNAVNDDLYHLKRIMVV